MALNDIKFIRQEGGLGRPLAGSDHISSMIFYTAGNLPSGFASDDRIKKIFSLPEAEALGIVDDHSDETKGTGGQVVIGGTWLADETATIKLDDGILGTHTVVTGATTINDVVQGLVDDINAETAAGRKHGWTATNTGGTTVSLTQPAKLGIKNNTAGITFEETSAAGTGTPTQFTGGVGSYFAVMHYHIAEYFRQQTKGVLYVAIYAQGTYDATEVKTVQDFAEGEIRQMAVYLSHETFTSGHLTTTQGVLDTLETEHRPMSVVFHSDLSSATLSTLSDLGTLSNERVTALIGEEGDYHQPAYSNTKAYLPGDKVTFQGGTYSARGNTTGNAPWDGVNWTFVRENLQAISGFSIGTTGIALGAVSFAAVNENIGWIAKFNLVSGTGLDEAAFATGDLYKDVTTSLKDSLDDFRYVFLRKHEGISGTYFNDSWTAITETSDFAAIENVRTMDKAVRDIRTNVLPNLGAPLFVNADGTLTEDTISLFKNDTERALVDMETSQEISAFSVTINPSQDVLATSKLIIGVLIVPVGVAREIEINIGFAVNVA